MNADKSPDRISVTFSHEERSGDTTRLVTPVERIEHAILVVRGHGVMLDGDLATLHGVETRVLVQAVKRTPGRVPKDFMFQMTNLELAAWRSACPRYPLAAQRSDCSAACPDDTA
jgi:hypothetical protein